MSIPASIAEPTVLYDLSDADYHGHRGSLSASGAKLLAPPAPCPAKYRWQRDNPVHKDEFDFGHVAHRLVLGKGAEVEVLPYENYKSTAAREARDEARAAGKAPILAPDYARAQELEAAVRADPLSGPLFTDGYAEVSLFWPDSETGVIRRARLDWIRNQHKGKRVLIGDLKTSRSAEPNAFGRSAADFGYAISAANYVDGAIACGLADDPAFLLAVVEKEPPYVVTTFQVEDDLLELGRVLMRKALHTYAACEASGVWPGYSQDVEPLELPGYWLHRVEESA